MRPILLGVLAAALLTKAVDAESDSDSANHVLPACQKFIAGVGRQHLSDWNSSWGVWFCTL
jgi:hypothetical protein